MRGGEVLIRARYLRKNEPKHSIVLDTLARFALEAMRKNEPRQSTKKGSNSTMGSSASVYRL